MKRFNRLLLTFGFLGLFSAITLPPAAAASFSFPPQLILANGQGWETAFVASSAEGGDFRYSDSGLIAPVHIVSNGSFFLRDSAKWQANPGLGIIPASEGIEAYSILSYRPDNILRAQFTVPVLTKVVFGDQLSGEIPRVVNDGTDMTTCVFINNSSTASSITLKVRDGANVIIGTEYVTLPPGLTAYALQTFVPAGRVEVLGGYGGSVGSGSQPAIVPVYGFAAIGPASGQTQRVEVMR
jgi:hypothetical protein